MRLLLLSFFILLSTSCALKIPPTESMAKSKSAAAIITTTDHRFKIMSIGPSISANIYTIDGGSVKPSSGKYEYWVKPGNREIVARCRMSMGSKSISGKDKIFIKLEKGKQYQLSASLITQLMKGSTTTCKPIIEKK